MSLVLVLNSGSSSVKFALFDVSNSETGIGLPLCQGNASRLNEPRDGDFQVTWADGRSDHKMLPNNDHAGAIDIILAYLREAGLLDNIVTVGHRVVHGGETYRTPVIVDEAVLDDLQQYNRFAPLHNPPALAGIRICLERLSSIPQVACFDTAFHGTLPPVAYHYPLPLHWQQLWRIRRYGFHGISHSYIASQLPLVMPERDDIRAVSAHLGNGCSLCALRDGRSVDTSMGFTPLEGLMMGSRCGDLDPGLHEYLCDRLKVDVKTLTALLNREAGLKGVSGLSNDMRTLLKAAEEGHEDSQLAVELFCYRMAKHIAACIVPLGRIDALVFTGGIGENAAPVRERVVTQLAGLGFRLDRDANAAARSDNRNIAAAGAPAIWVIPTREEGMIARQALQLVTAHQGSTP